MLKSLLEFSFYCENTPNRNTDYSVNSLTCSFENNQNTSVMFLVHVYDTTNTVFGSDAADIFYSAPILIHHFFFYIPACLYIWSWNLCDSALQFTYLVYKDLFFAVYYFLVYTVWLFGVLESADDGECF